LKIVKTENNIFVDSETVCLWVVDYSFDRALKTVLSTAKCEILIFLCFGYLA